MTLSDKQTSSYLNFIIIIAILFTTAYLIQPYPNLARWFGFLIAGYAAVANDSIQTIGTFISSNRQKPWWLLWLYVASIFIITISYSWLSNHGDVTFGRLAAKGFAQTPISFSFMQVAAPIFLLILTRLGMPVSTTFLLLTSFAATGQAISRVLFKSLSGYVVAFIASFLVWLIISKIVSRFTARPAHSLWRLFQWLSTGILWSVWLMQDASNIAVYLPRQLNLIELICFITPVTLGLGYMLRRGGSRLQVIVDEKSRVTDVRACTIIDIIYACVLYYFKIKSKIPMSTTWVFLGLLAGREIAISIRHCSDRQVFQALGISIKDVFLALIGLAISIAIAYETNPVMYSALNRWMTS